MEPTYEVELEIPETLYKAISETAMAHGRTMEEEIVARLGESIDRDETETNWQH